MKKRILLPLLLLAALGFFDGSLRAAGTNFFSTYPNTDTLLDTDLFILERPGVHTYNITKAQLPGALGLGSAAFTSSSDYAVAGSPQTVANTTSNLVFGNALTQINTTSNSLQSQITSGGVTLTQLNTTSNSVYGNAVTQINATSNTLAGVDATKADAATTITLNGTANQITSSAGAQSLAANRAWTFSLPNVLIAPGTFSATTSITNGGVYYGNGAGLTNVPAGGVTGLLDATGLGAGQIPYTGSTTNLLGSTNNVEFEAVLAPTSNATNYSADFLGPRKLEIFSANTNANITFANAGTNHAIDLYINALTSTVPCVVTFPAHIRLNHYASLTVSNTTAGYYHIDFFNGTDPTNAVVTGGDYYQIQ